MKKSLIPFLLVMLLALTGTKAQNDHLNHAEPKFSADTVKSAIDDLTKELSLKHPGFYRYNTVISFRQYIDSVKHTVTDSLTELEAFVKMKCIISKIGCLHTELSLHPNQRKNLNELPNLIPLQIYFNGDKAFVIKNKSAESLIATGDEVMSINARDIPTITSRLLALIPSDGYNQTLKYRALYYQFPLWYRYIEQATEFTVVIKRDDIQKTFHLKAVKWSEIAEDGFLKEPDIDQQLDFKIENNTAFLTIHSFAESQIKKGNQHYIKFIDQVFTEIKSRNIKNLVLDLRDNTGGSDPNAVYLTSYFFDKPFRYWDRIEVTEAIAKEIKGLSTRIFYRKPIQKDSIWLWQKAKTVKDFDYYELQQPAKNNFNGNTYLLVNGFCMSSCSDVIAILKHNNKAIVVGEETGGGYQGNNSGMMPESVVKPFSFSVTVPLQKYVNYVDASINTGRGTIPDYFINFNLNDLIENKDKAKDFVTGLISQNKFK
jgi:C-terminal processing protease CtpA/Prc